MKRKYGRPVVTGANTNPTKRLSSIRIANQPRHVPLGEHRGVTPGQSVQESAAERSRRKGKQIWRPRPHENGDFLEKIKGVTSGVHSRRSAANKIHQEWVLKKKDQVDERHGGRHLGESSKGSHRQFTPSEEETNLNQNPLIEELFVPHFEPDVHWKRRSEIRVQEEADNDEDTMEVEVVDMVDQANDQPGTRFYQSRRRTNQSTTQQEERVSSSSEDEPTEEPGDEEEPVLVDTAALAREQKQMQRLIKAKDKEISQLSAKMNEIMVQMNAMMGILQKNIAVGMVPVPLANNQASSSVTSHPPVNPIPQASGVQGASEGIVEFIPIVPQPTSQHGPNDDEHVTTAQLESLINEKIKAFMQAEKLVGKGRPYPAEYDQVPYPKGY